MNHIYISIYRYEKFYYKLDPYYGDNNFKILIRQ